MNNNFFQYLVSSIVFSVIGIIIFGIGFYILDRITPYKLWTEIVEKQNVAVSIFVGSCAIALGIVIGSAIHG
jgi:putative membrane protein